MIISAMACATPLASAHLSASQKEANSLFSWSQGNKHFTTSFYPYAKSSGHNFIFSPISLQLGLAMTAELALNETKEELLEKAVLPEDDLIRHLGAELIVNQLNINAVENESFKLSLANGAWFSTNIAFPSYFSDLLMQYYQATLRYANFHFFSEEIREEINAWVEENTLHQIQNLMPSGSLSFQTDLVLVNTLYMRAPWEKSFNPKDTYEGFFYGLEKSRRSIPYMHQKAILGYLEGEEYIVAELPFQQSISSNSDLSLFIILPKEEYSIQDIEEKLTTRRLDYWMANTEKRYLDLSLPKFKISSAINAKEMLQNLGMQRPFSPQEAEFDLKGAQRAVFITHIVHNAVFEIDEKGGTGAGGTGIAIHPTACPETTEVKVNHPFLIFVADKTSGIVLFAGRVMEPKS